MHTMINSIFAHRSKVVAQNNFHSYDMLPRLTMMCIGEDGTSSQIHIMVSLYSTYSGRLLGKKTCEFQGFVVICKHFLYEIWGRSVFWQHQRAIHGSFLSEKFYFPPIHECFLPRKFPIIWYILHCHLLDFE